MTTFAQLPVGAHYQIHLGQGRTLRGERVKVDDEHCRIASGDIRPAAPSSEVILVSTPDASQRRR